MARGKYKSTAEARQVRETAIEEAARLRREVDQMQHGVIAERDALRSECESLQSEVFRLRCLLKEGTSDQLREARDEVSTLKASLVEQRRSLGRALARLTRDKKFGVMQVGTDGGVAVWSILADLFDIPLGEFMTEAGSADSRHLRRMTAKKARTIVSLKDQGLI